MDNSATYTMQTYIGDEADADKINVRQRLVEEQILREALPPMMAKFPDSNRFIVTRPRSEIFIQSDPGITNPILGRRYMLTKISVSPSVLHVIQEPVPFNYQKLSISQLMVQTAREELVWRFKNLIYKYIRVPYRK